MKILHAFIYITTSAASVWAMDRPQNNDPIDVDLHWSLQVLRCQQLEILRNNPSAKAKAKALLNLGSYDFAESKYDEGLKNFKLVLKEKLAPCAIRAEAEFQILRRNFDVAQDGTSQQNKKSEYYIKKTLKLLETIGLCADAKFLMYVFLARITHSENDLSTANSYARQALAVPDVSPEKIDMTIQYLVVKKKKKKARRKGIVKNEVKKIDTESSLPKEGERLQFPQVIGPEATDYIKNEENANKKAQEAKNWHYELEPIISIKDIDFCLNIKRNDLQIEARMKEREVELKKLRKLKDMISDKKAYLTCIKYTHESDLMHFFYKVYDEEGQKIYIPYFELPRCQKTPPSCDYLPKK